MIFDILTFSGCRVEKEVYQNANQVLPESFLKRCAGFEVITHSLNCNKIFSGNLKSENIQMEIEFLRKVRNKYLSLKVNLLTSMFLWILWVKIKQKC